jgi:cobalt-zinc-cadmium efflux system outer membrane protein
MAMTKELPGIVFLAALALAPVVEAGDSHPRVGVEAAAISAAPLGATVQELLAWADQHNPELGAARHETDAAAARVEPAGALADPSFRIELQGIDRNNPNLLPNKVGSTKYTLFQTLPLWGKRDLRREVAEAELSQAKGKNASSVAEVHAQIKTAFAMYYQAQQTIKLNNEILRLMHDLERVAQARYTHGLTPQQDLIKAQLEQTALQSELIALEAEQHHALTRLNLALNRPTYAALVEPRELRPLPAVLDAVVLEKRILAASPLVAIQGAQVDAAEKNQQLTEKNRYPDLTLGISPIQRGNRLDSWDAMFEINIPLQQDSRRAREREAASLLAASKARQQALANQVQAAFRESLEGLGDARKQARLLKNTLLPQSELALQSALIGYQSGKVDFATLLEAQRQIKKARLTYLQAEVDQELRLTEIERLLGEEL